MGWAAGAIAVALGIAALAACGGDQATGPAANEPCASRSAEPELARLEPLVPRLTIALDGVPAEQVELTIDGTALQTKALQYTKHVNPGTHVVKARVGGGEEVSQTVEVPSGPSTTTVRFTLAPGATKATAFEAVTPRTERSEPNLRSLAQGSAFWLEERREPRQFSDPCRKDRRSGSKNGVNRANSPILAARIRVLARRTA